MIKKISLATAIMTASIFLSRLMGGLREVVIAHMAGADANVDAYLVAFTIPEILNHVMASGFLSVTFIPMFARYLAEENEPEGWHVFSVILSSFGFLLTLLILLAWWLTPWLLERMTGLPPQGLSQAVHMTRIVLPAQICFYVASMLMAVQFAKEHFFLPALMPLIYNLSIILGGWFLGPTLGMAGFAWGALTGAIVGGLVLQLVGAWRVGLRYRFTFNLRHPEVLHFIKLTLPLIVGFTTLFSTEVFFRIFGSYLGSGAVARLNYSLRLMLIVVALFGQAVGVASYPFMARLAAEKKIARLNQLLNGTLKYLAVVMPVSVWVMAIRFDIIRVLFQHGEFTARDTPETAHILMIFLAGAVAFAAQTIVPRAFYAIQNTLLPAVLGTVAVTACLPLYWVGMHFAGAPGVALAVSASATLQVLLIYLVWNRRTHNSESRAVFGFYGRMLLLSIVLGLLLEAARRGLWLIWPGDDYLICFLRMGCLTVCFGASLALLSYKLNIVEITELMSKILRQTGLRK